MGKIVTKDIFMGGFKYRYNDGIVEHFVPEVLGGGYKGANGSRINKQLFGGYRVVRKDGYSENFKV